MVEKTILKTAKSKERRTLNAYFKWLCSRVDRRNRDRVDEEFLKDLHEELFYGKIPNDDNRAIDGEELKEFFDLESDGAFDITMMNNQCTMLEMLIGLAERMDYILSHPNKECRTAEWFWLMINNLGLIQYICGDPEKDRKRRTNHIIIKKFLEREYSSDGKGGLFPLKKASDDQREVEIWYQMMLYIDENNL